MTMGHKTEFVGLFRIPTDKLITKAGDVKVSFVIAGTQKGGTSALDAYLRLSPKICMPHKTKEIHFFDTDQLFIDGEPDYRLYHASFKLKDRHRLLGEVTPDYMYSEEFARRAHAYNSAMKIIITLRNPVERAFSHWNMFKALGYESLSFGEAIRPQGILARATSGEERWRLNQRNDEGIGPFSYVERGFYVDQIRRIQSYFPARQILIIKQEELLDHHDATLSSICKFLEVEAIEPLEPIVKFMGSYSSPIGASDNTYLRELYWKEIGSLEQMLGWDCSDWLV